MSTASVASWDSDFLLICRELSVEPTEEVIQRRWIGACSVANTVSRENLAHLIRAAFGIRDVKGKPSSSWFREELTKADGAFALQNNEREMQLMGAATLLALFTVPTTMTDVAALACRTAGFGN